jgi:hypothetical protein
MHVCIQNKGQATKCMMLPYHRQKHMIITSAAAQQRHVRSFWLLITTICSMLICASEHMFPNLAAQTVTQCAVHTFGDHVHHVLLLDLGCGGAIQELLHLEPRPRVAKVPEGAQEAGQDAHQREVQGCLGPTL